MYVKLSVYRTLHFFDVSEEQKLYVENVKEFRKTFLG